MIVKYDSNPLSFVEPRNLSDLGIKSTFITPLLIKTVRYVKNRMTSPETLQLMFFYLRSVIYVYDE
jgi:hypothetical protein